MAQKPMTKSKIVSHFAGKFEPSKKTTSGIIEEVAPLAVSETKKTGSFILPGNGKLAVSKRKARMSRNPATGEPLTIPAKTVVRMRVAKAAREANQSFEERRMKWLEVVSRWIGISLVAVSWVGVANAQIHISEARIGCLDLKENAGNLTNTVGRACDGKWACSYKAPNPDQYKKMGIPVHGRTLCTEGMEITFRCGNGPDRSVSVPGDAWNNPPAQMACDPSSTPQANSGPVVNQQMVPVLQQLLAKYKNCILEHYEGKQPPDPALGPLRDIATCVAGNTCTIESRTAMYASLQAQANRGDSTNFESNLKSAILNDCFQCGKHHEWHTKQIHCTSDCGGNQSFFQDPLHFNAGIGPCFEGCKAGVDVTKLVNDIVNDIHSVLQGIGLAGYNEPGSVTGGASISADHTIVDPSSVAESCDARPLGYFVPSADLLDWTPTDAPQFKVELTGYGPGPSPTRQQYNLSALSANNENVKPNLGANEGRLRSDLRAAAARRDPLASLCQAAAAFAVGNGQEGNAFADLSVTGRHAYARFRAQPPQESQITACLQSNPKTKSLPAPQMQRAAGEALDRAYRVANIARAGGWPVTCPERSALGYIAVSGEDDQPNRPLNVPSAESPQYEIDVPVARPNKSPLMVHTRYMIAHTFPPSGSLSSCAATGRALPADRAPVLAPDAEVFLYIHGMDSRLEEALDLTRALHELGRQRHRNYTVISMDLPTSGYADNLDYNVIAPLTADGHAGGGVDGLGFAPNKYVVPMVDFIENFIVSFVNTLDRTTQVTHHEIIPIGGSLGGNMSFRLGRPRPDAPWIKTVVPWSPAAIWPSLADDGSKHAGLAVPWYFAGGDPAYQQEIPGARRSFFYGGFDWQSKVAGLIPLGGGRPQAEYWYRDGWQCKPTHMLLSRIDRYETYDENFRRWHWRLGMEQLQFSQQIPRPGSNPPEPLYLSNTKRMLLLCGMNDLGGDLCQDTRDVAPKMEMTPGKALFLKDTGHSIHNERPNYLARQIVDFVDAGSSSHAATSVSASAPLPQLEVAVCETSDGRSCTKTRLPGPAAPGKKFALKARVSVTSDGHPVQGAQVAVEGKSTLTNAGGVAVVGIEVRSELEKADAEPGTPKPAPHYIWIAPATRVSKAGYETSWAPMPISGN